MHARIARASPALLVCLFALFLAGCRSAPTDGDGNGDTAGVRGEDVVAPAPNRAPSRDPRSLSIFMGDSGLMLTWDSLVAQASSADAVLIGEMHGHATGLAFASALFEDVIARRPNTACLSMEFFSRDHQVALDDYVAGITEETTFRRAAMRSDGNYPSPHRAMVESARERSRPVVAANAPRRYVRLARTDGFDALRALNDRQRALVEIPASLTEGEYRERFYELMSAMAGHTDDSEGDPIEPFYRSQNVWDETMADSIADGVASGCSPIVHVVGKFHIDSQGGLVTRLREMAPSARVLTITTVEEWADDLLEVHASRADIVIYVGPRRSSPGM